MTKEKDIEHQQPLLLSEELGHLAPRPPSRCPFRNGSKSKLASIFVVALIAAPLTLLSLGCAHSSSPAEAFPFTEALWGLMKIPFLQNKQGEGCSQVDPLVPAYNANLTLDRLKGHSYKLEAAERLGGAIRINTVSTDEWRGKAPPPEGTEDPDHAGFPKLHAYLEKVFPLVHKHATRKLINRYGLLFTIPGTDPNAKPLLLMAHQDTVPVLEATRAQWTHDPWSGLVDEENGWIWGRGAADTKGTLVGILEALERLLEGGWQSKKGVIIAFGYDEEISGMEGAYPIAQYLKNELKLAGKVGLLVDEGGSFGQFQNVDMATVAVTEKGYVDVEIRVETPGGHASIPPDNNGIGLMALIVTMLEKSPYTPALEDNNPVINLLSCIVEHGEDVNPWLKFAMDHFSVMKPVLVWYANKYREYKYYLKTSQAIDIINGGAKVNALPEVVTTFINHRIATHSRVADVEAHLTELILPFAQKFNLDFEQHRADSAAPPTTVPALDPSQVKGKVIIRPVVGALEPAPISPTQGTPWNVLAGTIRHALRPPSNPQNENAEEAERLIVAPTLMPANTDTRHYWGLTDSIYRFSPVFESSGIHTVDERLGLDAFINGVIFFHELMRNWDEAQ
ncbi:hypothetical protein HDV05_007412 [Chytridiales sp. JEL 0842]|nr:hypothetical protein HDV05_007412 [Chytridiales sp. JEL 0842]